MYFPEDDEIPGLSPSATLPEDDDEGMFFESSAEAEGIQTSPPILSQNPSPKWNGVPSQSVYMPFGKYTDEPLENIPGDYLAWALSEIPLEFYSYYLPRFTQEAGSQWISFWESLYGEFLSTQTKTSRMNLAHSQVGVDITQDLQEKIKEASPHKGHLPTPIPVKARRNVFQIKGPESLVILRLKDTLHQATQGTQTYGALTILAATLNPKTGTVQAEYLVQKHHQPEEN